MEDIKAYKFSKNGKFLGSIRVKQGEELPSNTTLDNSYLNFFDPTWNGTQWEEGSDLDYIKKLRKIHVEDRYVYHEENGQKAYQDFRAQVVLDVEDGVITEEQAFAIESTLKVGFDKIKTKGDWKTGRFFLSQVVIEYDFIQPYYNNTMLLFNTYIENNYTT